MVKGKVTVNPRLVELTKMLDLTAQDYGPMVRDVDKLFRANERELFASEGASGGKKWVGLTPEYAEHKARVLTGMRELKRRSKASLWSLAREVAVGRKKPRIGSSGKVMTLTGNLRDSYTQEGHQQHLAEFDAAKRTLSVGTKNPLARYHQEASSRRGHGGFRRFISRDTIQQTAAQIESYRLAIAARLKLKLDRVERVLASWGKRAAFLILLVGVPAMANIAPDPGFEDNLWLCHGLAAQSNEFGALVGSQSLVMLSTAGFIGGSKGSDAVSPTFMMVPGATYGPYSGLVYLQEAASFTELIAFLDDGSGSVEIMAFNPTSFTPGVAQLIEFHPAFVAQGPIGRLRFATTTASPPGQLLSVLWLVDDLHLGGLQTVAIKLAERSVDAIVTRLQSQLATELALIDADRPDAVVLTAPASTDYYKRPKLEIAGSEAQICVFEDSFDFDNPYVDSDAQRATYQIPITVRLVLFNVNGDTPDTMINRARRYGVGIFNVFNKAPTLAGVDPAIKMVVSRSVRPAWELEPGKDNVLKASVEVPLTVTCEETQA